MRVIGPAISIFFEFRKTIRKTKYKFHSPVFTNIFLPPLKNLTKKTIFYRIEKASCEELFAFFTPAIKVCEGVRMMTKNRS